MPGSWPCSASLEVQAILLLLLRLPINVATAADLRLPIEARPNASAGEENSVTGNGNFMVFSNKTIVHVTRAQGADMVIRQLQVQSFPEIVTAPLCTRGRIGCEIDLRYFSGLRMDPVSQIQK